MSSLEWIRVAVFDLDEEDTPRKDSEKKTKEKKATVNEESKGGKESGVAALPCIDKLRDDLSCTICLEICFEPSTTPCGHRRFIRAAQGVSETPSLQLECLTKYIAELSLLESSMPCYAPSLIAASAIFLAKFILSLSTKPWNATLKHYTQYQPSNLCSCVRDLRLFCCNNPNSNLPAITEKYSQHKYENVAKKYYPPSIPSEYFQN
ncbi:cyclin-A1-4 isoform X2 [Arachis duranensis]|uniref:RING-type E3 ubiquitin transferase n=1 Tax=Arachis duranensis TaxID=130453 RepID=A0A9C6WNT1_ARADU|nr:cyclin-A1-4 isoform X1 [Arachis duranensis]XP_052116371.1 cyclin-A1-4 isoform X2 [Arachis duranensis]